MNTIVACLAISLLGCACTSVSVPWRGEEPLLRGPVDVSWDPLGFPGIQGEGAKAPAGDIIYLEHQEPREEEETEPPNAFALFLGGTYKEQEDGANADVSFALSYVRRITPLVAIGITLEGTPSTREPVLLFPALMLCPVRSLYLVLAPGLEFESGDPLRLLRIGAGWDFDLGDGWILAPEVNYDFVEHSKDAVVVGLAFSYHF